MEQFEGKTFKEVWADLGDTPTTADGDLEIPFLNYPAGTDTHDIWHDIEEHFDMSIGDYLNGVGAFGDDTEKEAFNRLRKHLYKEFGIKQKDDEEYYFISFWASSGGNGEVENDCIDEHPFEWQHRMNMAGPGVEVVENGLTAILISWKKIEKIEFDLFHA